MPTPFALAMTIIVNHKEKQKKIHWIKLQMVVADDALLSDHTESSLIEEVLSWLRMILMSKLSVLWMHEIIRNSYARTISSIA